MRAHALKELFILAVIITRLSAQGVVAEGPHSVVWAGGVEQDLADRARDFVEATIPIYAKLLPYALPAGEKLVFNLYATEAAYGAAVAAAGAPDLAQNLAGTAAKNRESYLVIEPRVERECLEAAGGLPELTRLLMCHEGVHQLIGRAGSPTADYWPFWYVEGMAEYVASSCLRELAADKAAPIPCADTASHDVRAWLDRGRLPSVSRILSASGRDATTAPHPLYSCCHSFYSFVASDPARLGKLEAEVRKLAAPASSKPLADRRRDVEARVTKAFADVFGAPEALEPAWHAFMKSREPPWFEAIRSSQFEGDSIVCSGFPGQNAVLIRTQAPGPNATWSFDVRIADLGARQADLYLQFDSFETTYVKVALGADGYVTSLVFDREWKRDQQFNAKVPRDTFGPSDWTPVRISVGAGRIKVAVRDKNVFDAPVPSGVDLSGPFWGVGSCDGSVVRFRNLRKDAR